MTRLAGAAATGAGPVSPARRAAEPGLTDRVIVAMAPRRVGKPRLDLASVRQSRWRERMEMKRWLSIPLLAVALLTIEAPAEAPVTRCGHAAGPPRRGGRVLRSVLRLVFGGCRRRDRQACLQRPVCPRRRQRARDPGRGASVGRRGLGASRRSGVRAVGHARTATSVFSASARRSSAAGACAIAGTVVCWVSTAGPMRSSRPARGGASSRSSGTIRACGAVPVAWR